MIDYTNRKIYFKITDGFGNVSMVTLFRGRVAYAGGTGIPLSLSNIADSKAMELQRELELAEEHRYDGAKNGGNIDEVHRRAMEAFNKYCYLGIKIEPLSSS
jgi:hypothetical protein